MVLYGPQGQVREREELLNVGQDNVPKGKTWYWLGANQPGRDLITLEKPPDTRISESAGGAVGRTWARYPHVASACWRGRCSSTTSG